MSTGRIYRDGLDFLKINFKEKKREIFKATTL
jgi:hypothetical protein